MGGGGRRGGDAPAPAPYVPPPPPPVQNTIANRAVDTGNRLVFDAPQSGPRGGDAMSGNTSLTDVKGMPSAPINTAEGPAATESGPQVMGMAKNKPYAATMRPRGSAAAAALANQQTSSTNSFQAPSVSGLRFGGS
jgi:hypothetical protein